MNKKNYYLPGSAAFFAADPDFYFLYNFLSKKTSIIKTESALIYSRLSGLKPIQKFKSEISDYLHTGIGKEILEEITGNNLIIQLPDLKNTGNQNHDIELAAITCNRPELLESALKSIAENIYSRHKNSTINVFDDSEDAYTQSLNRKTTGVIGQEYKIKTFYFGKSEKNHFLNLLKKQTSKKGISSELIEYALSGDPDLSFLPATGGNRNNSLLKLSGKKIICFDDDILFEPLSHNDNKSEIELAKNKIPDINIFSNMETVKKHFKPVEIDLISSISDILGEKTNDFLNRHIEKGKSVQYKDSSPEMTSALVKESSMITTVITGIYGGKWFSRPHGIYLNSSSTRKKEYKKKSDYSMLKANPFTTLHSNNILLSRFPFYAAALTGINLEVMVPPFPPNGRNQDGIWASLLQGLDNCSLIGHLPFSIFHDFSNKKKMSDETYQDTSADFGLITNLIIDSLIYYGDLFPVSNNYEKVGNSLITFSNLSDNDFIAFCHKKWMEYVCKIIEQIERLLEQYNHKPRHWASDAAEYIELLEKQSVIKTNSLPAEFRKKYSTEKAIKQYKLFFSNYGSLIKNWPAIWKAALEINTSGRK